MKRFSKKFNPKDLNLFTQSKIRAQEDGASSTAFRISSTWFLDYDKSPAHEACARIAKYSSIEAILAGLDAMSEWSGEKYLKHIENKTLILWGDGDRMQGVPVAAWTRP